MLSRLPNWLLDLIVRLLGWADDQVEVAIYDKHVRKWKKKLK